VKFGLVVIIALLASAFAAQFLLGDPGYVIINFRSYLVEMSVPVLVALILAGVIAVWLIVKIYRAPRRLGEAAGRYRSGRAGQRLTRGMIEIAEGNFSKGEKLLARAANVSDAPLLNYLQAARAAHLLGQDERRDTWLRHAYEQMPSAANAVLLTQAELQLDQEQFEQSLATLRKLEENSPNHGHALALMGRLYYQLGDWQNLAALLPKLRKHSRLDSDTLEQRTQEVHRQELEAAADADVLAEAWNRVPRNQRRNLDLVQSRLAALMRTGQHDLAEKELAAELKREWRAPLVALYGVIQPSNTSAQLKKAEGWLKLHPDDVDLLLAAGRLCIRNELWGKARSYLETVLAARPSPEAYQEYGLLLNQLGEGDAAADAYRQGLNMVAHSPLPAIPYLDGVDGDSDDGDAAMDQPA
jgi:HemY protein